MQNKRVFAFILMLISLLAGCSKSVVFHDTKGDAIPLSTLHGKWVVINYWASWCHNCMKEVPQLNRFYHILPNDTLIYGVNIESLPPSQLAEVVHQKYIQFPVLIEDPASFFGLDTVTGVPVTFIINPKGKCVKVIYGPTTDVQLSSFLLTLKTHETT